MKRLLVLLLLLFAVIILKGQTQPYDMIDTADLKLTPCNFEKEINAIVSFNNMVPKLLCNLHYP